MSSFHPSRGHGWRDRRSRWGPPPQGSTPGHVLVPLYPTYGGGWAPYGMPAARWCPPHPRGGNNERSDRPNRTPRRRENRDSQSNRQDRNRERDRSRSRNRDRDRRRTTGPPASSSSRTPTHTLRQLERFAKEDATCISIAEFSKLRRDFPCINPDLFHDLFWVAEGRSADDAVQSIRKALRRARFSHCPPQEIFRTRYMFLKQKYTERYGFDSWRKVPSSTAESSLFDNSLKQAVLAIRMQYFATQSNIEQFYDEITWIEEQSRVITERQKKMKASTFVDQCPTAKYSKAEHGCQKCWVWNHGDDLEEGEEVRILPCGHMCHTECVDTLIQHALKDKKTPKCGICGKKIPDAPAPADVPDEPGEVDEHELATSSPSAPDTRLPEGEASDSDERASSRGQGPPRQPPPPPGPPPGRQRREYEEPLILPEPPMPRWSPLRPGRRSNRRRNDYRRRYGDGSRTGSEATSGESEGEVEGSQFEESSGQHGAGVDDSAYEEPREDHVPLEILQY